MGNGHSRPADRQRHGVHGRVHHVVIDCPDPILLARFYSELLAQPITYDSHDFVVVAANDTTSGLAFQRAADHRPPTWPDNAVPQQLHLDIMVDSVEEAIPQVLALGATELEGDHVFADPAGHPFCLVPRPGWAEPISDLAKGVDMTRTTITGVHHAALNVRDLDASLRWYHEVLDFSLLMPWDTDAFERRLMGHPSGLFLALTKHRHPDADSDFNERRPGLDHLAFGVPTMAELQAWSARLTAAGVEHSGIRVSPATGFTLIDFRDPDNIQLELYLAAS